MNSHYDFPNEFKVVSLRERPTPEEMILCDKPEKAVEYWKAHIETSPHFNPEVECLAVLFLNSRLKIKGHQIVSIGSISQTVAHNREVFRSAIVASSAQICLMHNHPSGESEPSEPDKRFTRDAIRAGQIIGIDLADHVIVGNGNFSSLKSLGYFY